MTGVEHKHEEVEGYRLSPQQLHAWRIAGRGVVARAELTLAGDLDVAALQGAVADVVAANEVLRTELHLLHGTSTPVQVIGEGGALALEIVDLTGATGDELDRRLGVLRGAQSAGSAPAIALWRTGSGDRLAVALPPALGDAVGLRNLVTELMAAYAARCGATGASDEDEPMQYADLAEWLNELLEEGEGATFPISSAALDPELPFDVAPANAEPSLAACDVPVSADMAAAVGRCATEHGVSHGVVWLAAWRGLLGRLIGGETAIGVSCDGRTYEGLDRALGAFARDLPLASAIGERETYSALVERTAAELAGLVERQEHFCWSRVTGAERRRESREFFAVGFAHDDWSGPIEGGGLRVAAVDPRCCTERCVVRLVSADTPTGAVARLFHDATRCRAVDVERLASRLARFVEVVTRDPDTAIADLDILAPAERARLLGEFHGERVAVDADRCMHELIAAVAERAPDHPAVVCGDAELTYRELLARADAIAGRLVAFGAGPESLVGVCVDRSVEMIVALVATLRAGAAYVPLDPGYPRDRLAFMLEDTRAPVVLTRRHLVEQLPDSRAEVVVIEDEAASAPVVVAAPTPNSLAYVIYTSGSTGTPKGVEIAHRNLVHSTLVRDVVYGESPARYLLLSSFAFDSSIPGIFWTLATGGTLVLPAEGKERDLHEIARLIETREITHTLALPSLYSVLLRETGGRGLQSLRTVIVAGEACPRELLDQHAETLPSARLFNEYGPTEGTVWCTVHHCVAAGSGRRVPIGRPIPNARIHVVDPGMRPTPIGVPGEIYVGGPGVGRGYLRRPELTAERFVADPFVEGERLYRTGDRGRWLEDGSLEFLGRVDNQVKIRGHRIELEEIESVLVGAPGIDEVVVVAQADPTGDQRLCAFAIGEPAAVAKLAEFAAARLPEYMVPASTVAVDALPRMPNGKVDRAALAERETERAGSGVPFVAPRTAVESALAAMWRDVLHVDRVGVDDNFFRLGGHSLLVTQLTFRLRETFGVELSLRAVFDHPTVGELAGLLSADEAQRERIERAVAAIGETPPVDGSST